MSKTLLSKAVKVGKSCKQLVKKHTCNSTIINYYCSKKYICYEKNIGNRWLRLYWFAYSG